MRHWRLMLVLALALALGLAVGVALGQREVTAQVAPPPLAADAASPFAASNAALIQGVQLGPARPLKDGQAGQKYIISDLTGDICTVEP